MVTRSVNRSALLVLLVEVHVDYKAMVKFLVTYYCGQGKNSKLENLTQKLIS